MQWRQKKQMPSHNQTLREGKPSLRLSLRMQGKSSTWATFGLLCSWPAGLLTLVICHDGEPAPVPATHSAFHSQEPPSTFFSVSWHLLSQGFLQFLPTAKPMSFFMSYNQTLRVVIWYLQSLSYIKYSCWTEYFFQFSDSADPNLHSVSYGVDRWSVFSKKVWLAQMPLVNRVFSKNRL